MFIHTRVYNFWPRFSTTATLPGNSKLILFSTGMWLPYKDSNLHYLLQCEFGMSYRRQRQLVGSNKDEVSSAHSIRAPWTGHGCGEKVKPSCNTTHNQVALRCKQALSVLLCKCSTWCTRSSLQHSPGIHSDNLCTLNSSSPGSFLLVKGFETFAEDEIRYLKRPQGKKRA